MKNRWERQKEVFEIIKDNESISVGELAEILEIDVSLANSLLRHYHKNKYLKREPNPENNYRYSYQLTEKGIKQYENFLKDGDYKMYQEVYTDSYKD